MVKYVAIPIVKHYILTVTIAMVTPYSLPNLTTDPWVKLNHSDYNNTLELL